MPTFVIACAGTLGDHLPYIALGQGLRRRGHRVRLACRPAMQGFATQAGLEVADCGEDFDDADARRRAHEWDEWGVAPGPQPAVGLDTPLTTMRERLRRDLAPTYRALATACSGADLLVAGLQRQMYAALLARNTGLPWVAASVTPALQCSAVGQHQLRQNEALMGAFVPLMDILCREQALQPIDWLAYDRQQPRALLGASAHFALPLPEQAHYQPTGFWFYEDARWRDWTPPPGLQDFVARHPQPLFLSFSSIPVIDPVAVLNLHARAAALLGRGLVVQRGAAGFDAAMLAGDVEGRGVHFVDFMPQDWLLGQCGAMLHHGGAGTIARALLNGCPMVAEPLGNDQFFNAQRVLALQIGSAVNLHRIQPEGLARVLADKVLVQPARDHARALGELLRGEDGVARACDLLEAWLP